MAASAHPRRGPATAATLNAAVAPFRATPPARPRSSISHPLIQQGHVRHEDDAYALTETGHDLVEALTTEVQATRDLTTSGVC